MNDKMNLGEWLDEEVKHGTATRLPEYDESTAEAELAALHDLLAGAVPLLELAAVAGAWLQCEHCPARDGCPAFDGGARDTWPCYTTAAQLRKLAQALREVLER